MVAGHNELTAPPGSPANYEMVGLDCAIIMHPQVWKVSGHYDLFHDFMVDCQESKNATATIRSKAARSGGRDSESSWPRPGQKAEDTLPAEFSLRAKNAMSPMGRHGSLTTPDFKACSTDANNGHADEPRII
jgi:glycyl-tRNA synthetase